MHLFIKTLFLAGFILCCLPTAKAQPVITSSSVEKTISDINQSLSLAKKSNYKAFFKNFAVEGLTLKIDYTRDGENKVYEITESNLEDIGQFAYIFSGFAEFEDRFIARDNRSAAGNFRMLAIVNSRSDQNAQVTAQTNCVYNIVEKDKGIRISKYECRSRANTISRQQSN